MNHPKINIFIPLYNCEKTIKSTINSLLCQSYDNFNLIISDNHSTDNSIKIINQFNDNRLKIIKTPYHYDMSEPNFNRCLDLSDELFTALLHADDIYHEDFLKNQVNNLLSDETIAISFTEGENIDIQGKFIRKLKSPKEMKLQNLSFWDLYPLILENFNFIITPSLVLRTEIFKKNNFKWNYTQFKTSSDLALWLEVSLKYKISIIKKNLISVKLSSMQGSSEARNKIQQSDFFLVLDGYNHYFSEDNYKSNFICHNLKLLKSRDNLRILCNLIYLKENIDLNDFFSKSINFEILLRCYKKKYLKHFLLYCFLRLFNLIGLNKLNFMLVSKLKQKYLI